MSSIRTPEMKETIIKPNAIHEWPATPRRVSKNSDRPWPIVTAVAIITDTNNAPANTENSNIKDNERINISNIDIAPTIAQLLHLDKSNPTIYKKLIGKSLLNPISKDRPIIALNTNDVRHWNHEGFGIFINNFHLIFTDTKGIKAFDILKDPLQANNIWNNLNKETKSYFINTIQSNYHLNRIAKTKIGSIIKNITKE